MRFQHLFPMVGIFAFSAAAYGEANTQNHKINLNSPYLQTGVNGTAKYHRVDGVQAEVNAKYGVLEGKSKLAITDSLGNDAPALDLEFEGRSVDAGIHAAYGGDKLTLGILTNSNNSDSKVTIDGNIPGVGPYSAESTSNSVSHTVLPYVGVTLLDSITVSAAYQHSSYRSDETETENSYGASALYHQGRFELGLGYSPEFDDEDIPAAYQGFGRINITDAISLGAIYQISLDSELESNSEAGTEDTTTARLDGIVHIGSGHLQLSYTRVDSKISRIEENTAQQLGVGAYTNITNGTYFGIDTTYTMSETEYSGDNGQDSDFAIADVALTLGMAID